jgi:dihydroorotase-like cyclic amidohydrolase
MGYNSGELIKLPALIDPHVHLREPGTNKAETIASGTYAAAIGGYALIKDMPNNPGQPTWYLDRLEEKNSIAERDANILVAFAAGSQPEEDNIGELEAMAELAIDLKLYGAPTTGNHNDYSAMDFEPIVREWHRVAPDKPILFHAGEDNLADMIQLVAGQNDHQLHVCHVNDPLQVKRVNLAREGGLDVTCGVCPHHILKTSHDRVTEGKFAEMMPGLADQPDAEKLMWQLAEGEIQMLESDHAPHTKDAKMEAERSGGSCYGVPGIEQIVPLMLYQVLRGRISRERLVDAMSTQPAQLLGLRPSPETYTIWELKEGRIDSEENLATGAGWTPYLGMLTGGELKMSVIKRQSIVRDDKVRKLTHQPVSNRGTAV